MPSWLDKAKEIAKRVADDTKQAVETAGLGNIVDKASKMVSGQSNPKVTDDQQAVNSVKSESAGSSENVKQADQQTDQTDPKN